MNFSTETVGRLLATGRGYTQYIVGFATSFGLLTAANSKGLTDGFSDIFAGIAQAFQGFSHVWQIGVIVLAPISSIILAKWSSNSAKTSNQAAAVVDAIKDPNTNVEIATKASVLDAVANMDELKTPQIKVTDPVLANLVPSDKVTT